MINKGDIVKMVKTETWLTPMDIGDEFVVQEIDYGVATIYSDINERCYYLAQDTLEKYFEKIVIKPNEVNDEDYDYIEDMINHSRIAISKVFNKCTIVACQLPNGFVIVESSACIEPKDYDEAIGVEACLNRIKNRVREMEAYAIHDECYNPFSDDDCDCSNCECKDSCPDCTNDD